MKIKSIKSIGQHVVWDLTVEEDHSYKVGSFINHNSSGPNLQVLPSRGKPGNYHPAVQKKGPELRLAFTAPPPDEVSPEGYSLLVTDHSQIELRTIAHFSGDENLTAVYLEYEKFCGVKYYIGDVHQKTADEVNCARKDAKSINFGFNYGMGAPKYAVQNRVFLEGTKDYDYEKCNRFRTGFFKTYRNIEQFMNYCGAAYKSGERTFPTLAGRLRHFYNGDRLGFNPAKGQILNSIIQGSAGDILKYVIYIVRKYLYPRYPGLQLIGQIHDELVYVLPNKYAEELGVLIKYVMEYPWYPLDVPILATAKVCESWGAKDDDNIPEVGVYYARINGEQRLFTADNWDEFLAADAAGTVEVKAAAAQLTEEQVAFCKTIIPHDPPPKQRPEPGKTRVMSRQEMLDAGMI